MKSALDQGSSLMQQLIKRVLTIVAQRTPEDRTSVVLNRASGQIYVFTVAFHLELLEVGGKITQGEVIRKHRVGFGLEEVSVPDPYQTEHNRQILRQVSVSKMLVHLGRPFQKIFERPHTN